MPRIEALYCLMMPDAGPDDEGVPAVGLSGVGTVPMMGADRARILLLWEIAKERFPKAALDRMRLLRFTVREDLTELLR